MQRIKARLWAALAALGLALTALFTAAAPAQAYHFFGPTWRVNVQPVITVSDRNGYDFNENEATYAWGSLAADDMSMAYTQYETCTLCIKVYAASLGGSYVRVTPSEVTDSNGRTWTGACVLQIDPAKTGTYWKARQEAVSYGIGLCLGFLASSAGQDTMNPYNLGHPDNAYKPSSQEYAELDYYYSSPFPQP